MNQNPLHQIIKERSESVLAGERITLLLEDVYLTITSEEEGNGQKKIITLVEKWDKKLNYTLDELIDMEG